MHKTIKQGFGFAVVGFFGVIINGMVFSLLSKIELLRNAPLPFWKELTWAWGFGILVAFAFNFSFDKWVVFRS